MEYGSRLRFVIITLVAIVLLALSAWGIASVSKRIFGGSKTATTQEQKIELLDYDRPSTSVKLVVQGPIVADEQFVSYVIEVGQDFRQITLYKGYGNTIVQQKRYDNNPQAYRAFLEALRRAGYTSKVKGASDNEQGACATGKRYVYELNDLDEQVMRTWGVSCTSSQGSFGGTGSAVRSLFKSQVPDYTTLLKGSGLI